MLGIILCGGQSSRMGFDKGLITQQAITWAQIAISKMEKLDLTVQLSVSIQQSEQYYGLFKNNHLIEDNESLNLKGPLCGILSAHIKNPDEALFVLACDMPLMETFILKDLLKYFRSEIGDAHIYTNDGFNEPLCGIYTANGLRKDYFITLRQGCLKKRACKMFY